MKKTLSRRPWTFLQSLAPTMFDTCQNKCRKYNYGGTYRRLSKHSRAMCQAVWLLMRIHMARYRTINKIAYGKLVALHPAVLWPNQRLWCVHQASLLVTSMTTPRSPDLEVQYSSKTASRVEDSIGRQVKELLPASWGLTGRRWLADGLPGQGDREKKGEKGVKWRKVNVAS